MKGRALVLFCLVMFLNFYGHCQATQTVHLKPIYKQGLNYYYNFKRVDGGAYGLQIPLQSLEDPVINKYYSNFRRYRKFEVVASFVPLAYILTVASNTGPGRRRLDSKTFYEVYGGSLVAIIAMELLAQHQLRKAIDRYNETILDRNNVGLIVQPIENKTVFGLAFTHKF